MAWAKCCTAARRSTHFASVVAARPQRQLVHVAVHGFGQDLATTHAEFVREGSTAHGRQSQTWVRFTDGWKVVAAHVSLQGSHA